MIKVSNDVGQAGHAPVIQGDTGRRCRLETWGKGGSCGGRGWGDEIHESSNHNFYICWQVCSFDLKVSNDRSVALVMLQQLRRIEGFWSQLGKKKLGGGGVRK